MAVSRATAGRDSDAVRPARMQELDRVAALWSAITEHHAPLDPLFRMRAGADSELRELLGSLMRDPDALVLVYRDGDDLPGMCIVRIDRAPPILEEIERAEITDLGVREDARRHGIGREWPHRPVLLIQHHRCNGRRRRPRHRCRRRGGYDHRGGRRSLRGPGHGASGGDRAGDRAGLDPAER